MTHSSLSIIALAAASAASAATVAGFAAPAAAQDLQRGETVLERPRPEVEQLGVHAGGFTILPRLELGSTYDSNVFATQTDTKHDFIYVARPQLDVRSNWNNHALNLSASGNIARYNDYSRLNYQDYRIAADGRVDVLRDTALTAQAFHNRDHEGPGDPDVVGTVERPIVYRQSGFGAGLNQRFNRVRARLTGLATYYDYDDAKLVGGTTISQEDRNRWIYSGSLRVGYEFIDGYEAFVQGTLNRTRYTRATDFGGIDHDSSGSEYVAGASADLTGLLSGEVYAGYLSKEYKDARLKDFGGLALGGALTWTVTQLTTVTARVSRQVRETTVFQFGSQASSYTRTLVAIGVDHELLRSLLLNGRVQAREDKFNGVDRNDKVYTLGLGATYNINRNVYLTGGYTYEKRNSNTVNDYSDNLLFLRLGAQM